MQRVFNIAGVHRHYDGNGYLYVDACPVLKAGILEYLGSELADEDGTVDGVKVEPDKVYKVFISPEELEKAKDTFNLKPITNDHTWLGADGEDAKKYQEGTTGEKSFIQDGKLYVDLVFTGKQIIDDIKSGKEELSASYNNIFKKSDNPNYDFVALDYKGNHIALVDKGRCGSDVRVLNSKFNKMEDLMPKKVKNEAILLKVGDKEIDLGKFFAEEAGEQADGKNLHQESISQNEDKRKLIDEIGGICKSAGMDEEQIRTVIEKAEQLSYNPSETSTTDNCDDPTKSNNEDGADGEPKKPVDNAEDEGEPKKDDEPKKAENASVIYKKIENKLMEAERTRQANLKKAYNAASKILGEFNPFGMTAREMYVKALNHVGVSVDKETDEQLESMLKVCNSSAVRVDNGFSYSDSYAETDDVKEIEI